MAAEGGIGPLRHAEKLTGYLIDLAMDKRSAAGKVWVGIYGSTGKIAFTAPNGDRHRLNPHPLIMVYRIVSNSDKSSVGYSPNLE